MCCVKLLLVFLVPEGSIWCPSCRLSGRWCELFESEEELSLVRLEGSVAFDLAVAAALYLAIFDRRFCLGDNEDSTGEGCRCVGRSLRLGKEGRFMTSLIPPHHAHSPSHDYNAHNRWPTNIPNLQLL